jgi:ubiquitin carboxyl-terminal hydrolase L3
MTALAHRLGLSPALSFHDVYSLTDPDLVSLIPRPCAALLFVFPITATSEAFFASEDAKMVPYDSAGDEPVLWFHQTIHHACGLIGLLHCVTNGSSRNLIESSSDLHRLMSEAIPLRPAERSQLLERSEFLERAHAEAAQKGDTAAPPLGEDPGHGFLAFVKGTDGHLWELEGRCKGPIDRGELAEDEDVLCDRALRMGPLPFLEREAEAGQGVLRFSCTALGPSTD